MNQWIIKILNKEGQEERIVEAIGYVPDRIIEILKEIHPEWNVAEVLPAEKTKQAI